MDEVREALFPLSGIDVSCEVDRQTPRTTARGVNVRACDPRTLRVRGAARPGLSKLLGATVSGLAGFPVQHLNVIVDPTVAALLASDEAAMSPPGAVSDPSTNNAAGGSTNSDDPLVRNPGRTIRDGGSGIQPNRHVPATPLFVQKAGLLANSTAAATRTDMIAYPSNVSTGSLLVVAVLLDDSGLRPFAVSDSRGNVWTTGVQQLGAGATAPLFSRRPTMALVHAISVDSGPCTVSVLVGGFAGLTDPASYVVLEYRSPWNLTPLDASVVGTGDFGPASSGSLQTAAFGILGSNRLVLGNFAVALVPTPASPFSERGKDGPVTYRMEVIEYVVGSTGQPAGLTPKTSLAGVGTIGYSWGAVGGAYRRS